MLEMIGNNTLDTDVGADAVAGILDGAKVGLFKTAVPTNRQTLFATLDAAKANYAGYALETITWGPVSIGDDGSIEYQGIAGEFRPTDAVTPNSVYGFYVVDTTGLILLFCGTFENGPLPMASALDNIILTLRWRPRTGGIVNVIS